MISLLSLNAHSLEEKNMQKKQLQFVEAVERLHPDIIALQEVNQTMTDAVVAVPADFEILNQDVSLRKDNHALALQVLLEKKNLHYRVIWLPLKVGYDKYDEGLALLSKKPVLKAWEILLSKTDIYSDARTRKALAIQTEDGIFVSTHMSWWKDGFASELNALMDKTASERFNTVIMGDFNADAAIKNEGYSLMMEKGLYDFYSHARQKDDGFTVVETIDGWRDQEHEAHMRIDYMLSLKPCTVDEIRTAFNGKEEPIVSDHFGLYARCDLK